MPSRSRSANDPAQRVQRALSANRVLSVRVSVTSVSVSRVACREDLPYFHPVWAWGSNLGPVRDGYL